MQEKQSSSELVMVTSTADIIAHAERQQYFESTTQVFIEQNNSYRSLDEGGLIGFFETIEISLSRQKHVGNLTILVPGRIKRSHQKNQLCISAFLFKRLVGIFGIPSTVLQAAFDVDYMSRACGLGLFGRGDDLELFYPCIITGDRCFVYTRALSNGLGFVNIILRPPPNLPRAWMDAVTKAETPESTAPDRHPLRFHLVFLDHLITLSDGKMSGMRNTVIPFEMDAHQNWLKHNKRRQLYRLHRLAQVMRITAENNDDMVAMIDLLQRADQRLEQSEEFGDHLSTLLSRTHASRRWAMNYVERIKILIDLAFHIATQDISEVNHEDSTSMNTIAVVTLIFLPGTLVCAIFSTVFFDIAFEDNGAEILHLSSRIWYFFAITIPLTMAVVAFWWMWKRRTVKRRLWADQVAAELEPK